MTPSIERRESGSALAFLVRIAVAVTILVLGWRLKLFLGRGIAAVEHPYEMDYGEGIVWQQMRQVLDLSAYGPIDGFPAIVFHYPPVFYLVAGGVSQLTGLDGLAAGRLSSFLSTLVAAIFVGLISVKVLPERDLRARWLGAAAASLVMLSWFPVSLWAPLMRVDMVGLALTLSGFYLALNAARRPRLIYLSALLFVAAVYNKQTLIAAPVAAYLALLFFRPRTALLGIATSFLAGAAVLAGLVAATDAGFVRHVFLYNVNRFEPARLELVPQMAGFHAEFVLIALLGVALAWRALGVGRTVRSLAGMVQDLRARPGALPVLACSLYLALSSVMLVLVGKVGANMNYLIEWMAVLSLFIGAGIGPTLAVVTAERDARPSWLVAAGATLLPLALACNAVLTTVPTEAGRKSPTEVAEMPALLERIRLADRPVISDDMVAVIKGGKDVVWEAAIFSELDATGMHDERPFIRMIDSGSFAFFATESSRGHEEYDSRYSPALEAAIDRNYPRKERLAGLTLHLPAAPSTSEGGSPPRGEPRR